ncbi:MAG TPA: hypothetical protein VNT03_17405 [Baekduia sp.]|nr:hypothetical protein [Baekduia sp.]
MPRRRMSLAAVVAVACALAGCGADEEGAVEGGPSAEQQVRTVVAKFGIATRAKDYQEICDRLLADALVQKIEGVGLPCEVALQRGLGDVKDPTLEIDEVSISRGRALVSIHTTAAGQAPSDDALQLVLEGREWKIASLAAPSATPTQTETQTATSATATSPPATTR